MDRVSSKLSALDGFRLPLEGGRLLVRQRSLWGLATVPVGFSLIAFGTAISLIVGYSSEIHGLLTEWMPSLLAGAWYTWIWIGPARAFFWLLGGLLFAVVAAAALVVAFVLANVLAAPFLDALAYRVERLESGDGGEEEPVGWLGSVADMFRSLRQELNRAVFFLSVIGALSVFGAVIPGAQFITGPAIIAFAIFFLPLDYASYTMDRRRMSFRDKRAWLTSNPPATMGFGLAAFIACAVPGLNLVAMPVLVVGGTLFAIRQRT